MRSSCETLMTKSLRMCSSFSSSACSVSRRSSMNSSFSLVSLSLVESKPKHAAGGTGEARAEVSFGQLAGEVDDGSQAAGDVAGEDGGQDHEGQKREGGGEQHVIANRADLGVDGGGGHGQAKRAALVRNRDIEQPDAEGGAHPQAGADLPLQGGGDFGPRVVVFHRARDRYRNRPEPAAGVDPGDTRAPVALASWLKSARLLGKHERDGAGFFGELLAELVEERVLDALGDEVIDGDEREGENRHQAQDELTEDARGQDSLWHREDHSSMQAQAHGLTVFGVTRRPGAARTCGRAERTCGGPRRACRIAIEDPRDRGFERFEDFDRRPRGIDDLKAVRLRQAVEHADQARLIAHEAVVHVPAEAQIQAAFPVIERAAAHHHARDQIASLRRADTKPRAAPARIRRSSRSRRDSRRGRWRAP